MNMFNQDADLPLSKLRDNLHGSPAGQSLGSGLSHQDMLIAASDYVKTFGLPEVLQFEIRDQAKWISCLDPDIASKRSWSMSVKILEQRNRNYNRIVERITRTGWHQRKKSAFKALLGFEWPL